MMPVRSWRVLALAVVAGMAFWLAATGPKEILGVDVGNLGIVALMACLWLSLWWLSSVPVEELEAAASPSEWEAWIGLIFLGLAIVYFLVKLPLFVVAGPITEHPDAARAGRNVVMLGIAWVVLSTVLGSRWRDRAQVDERDRQIAARACSWGRGVLVALLAILAVLLGLSPADRLAWATPVMLANMMILAMMMAHWVEIAVQAISYWRERH